jgi:uncharacterized phage infection (PIP) family protein YhgE
MSTDDSDNFRFGSDQVNPEDFLREAPADKRVARLSRRVTILMLLFPLLAGGALYFIYNDLKNRVIQNQTHGTQSVESLAETLDTRLKSFSDQITQMETTLAERMAGTEKSVQNLKTQFGQAESGLKKAVAGMKAMDAAKLEKKDLDRLTADMAALSAQLKARENDMAERLSDLTAVTQKQVNDILKLRTEVTTLTDSKVDPNMLRKEIVEQQQRLTALSNDLDKKLMAIRNDLRGLEKDLLMVRRSFQASPGSAAGSGPDGIIEKNLD